MLGNDTTIFPKNKQQFVRSPRNFTKASQDFSNIKLANLIMHNNYPLQSDIGGDK